MTTPQPGDGSDSGHDAHLREALRHAPDAGMSAPPALTSVILRQARLAVQPAPWVRWLHGARSAWTAVTRPPVAAALASVMVASTLTLLWRNGLMDQPVDRPPPAAASPAVAAAPPATPPAVATDAATGAPTPTSKARTTAAQAERAAADIVPPARQPSPSPAATPPAVAPPAPNLRSAARPAPQRSPEAAAEPGESSQAAAGSLPGVGADPASNAAAKTAALPTPTPTPTPTPAPAPAVAAAETAPLLARAAPPPEPAPAAPTGPDSRAAATPPRAHAYSRAPAAPAAATAPDRPAQRNAGAGKALATAAPARSTRDSLADLALELKSEPMRWSLRRDTGASQPIEDSVTTWLQALARELDDAAVQRAPPALDAAAPPSARVSEPSTDPLANGASLVLARDGRTQHRFELSGDRVIWLRSNARTMRLLPQAALRRLADALPAPASTPPPTSQR